MRRTLTSRAGRRPAITLLCAALLVSATGCTGEPPTGPNEVRQVSIVTRLDSLRPGQMLRVFAVALNRSGEVVDAQIAWRSLTPSTLAVDPNGAVFGLAPGLGIVRASVGNVLSERRFLLVNPPAVNIVVEPESLTLALPGVAARVMAIPLDISAIPIVGSPLTWTTSASRIVSVAPNGDMTPNAVGRAMVTVSLEGVERHIPVTVVPEIAPNAPILNTLSPAVIGPGVPFTIRGRRLAPSLIGTTVHVDGRAAQILTVTDTLITALLASGGLPCAPTADVSVQVRTSQGVGAHAVRLQLAPQRDVAVGGALLLLNATDASCLELPGEGRYMLTLLNTARAFGAGDIGVTLEGRAGLGAAVSIIAPDATVRTAESSAHLRLLEQSAAAVRALRASQPSAFAEVVVAPIGQLTAFRVPDLDSPNLCANYRSIAARTVYVGNSVIIVEDTVSQLFGNATLSGTMDGAISALGAEIDNVLWPLLARFGNPLVMDSRLDANGRVVVVLTSAINSMAGGNVAGAVATCDFFPRSSVNASSNVGEVLYLQVPRVTNLGDEATALARWKYEIRGTVAHELKHVVGFAEHIVRGQPLEESWLEEATARHAEELFARALTGATATGNTGYEGVRCEARALSGDAACANTPAMVLPSMEGYWQFLASPTARSPLGAASDGDFSFYGSAWSLLRWAMDHAVADEISFTQSLSTSGASGVSNLEARSGRSWEDLLARWSLASITDGRAGMLPTDATLRFRSWNFADVFAGLCADIGTCGATPEAGTVFTRAHPVQAIPTAADFVLVVHAIAPAGFAVVDVQPTGAGTRRMLRLSGVNGAPIPSTARLALVRLQ